MKRINKTHKAIAGSILMLVSFILYKVLDYELVTIIAMMLTVVLCGYQIFKKAIVSLRYKIIGIEALVTIAVIGAIILGEYYEASAVTFLFMIGDYLEAKTIEKTRASIRSLLNLAPKFARVRRFDQEVEIDPDEVNVGEIVIIKHGEKVAIDGKIIKGEGSINQSAITGESIPVLRSVGEMVYSGTILENGYLEVEASKVGEDTIFSRILEMVEEAQDKKAKTQKFIERFSKYYTPAIIVLSLLLYLIKKDIYLSLTLLVIACPGALVISTPISIVAGIGNGAKNGVLFKGGEAIEKLAHAKVLAFDKTGTITVGYPDVTHIYSDKYEESQVLKISALGELHLVHPLALAIINKAKAMNLDLNEEIKDIKILNGRGIIYNYNNELYFLGNQKLMIENNIDLSHYLKYIDVEEEKAQTVVILANTKEVVGIISIKDTIRTNVKESFASLRKLGIKKLIMLTGDNNKTAQAINHEVYFDEVYSDLLPNDKLSIISEVKKQYGNVVMVGDGVNDAPALATADLGIAIGGMGKDVAMDVADIILMSEQVDKVNYAYALSKSTNRNMKQNIIFAVMVAVFLVVGVIFEKINLALGMLIHELSVLLVIINASRLLLFKKDK